MRKFLLALFLSIFLLSGLLGFGVVRQVRAVTESEPVHQTPASQVNLILVHVDDLKRERPGLSSIWGVFISRSVFPALIMKRIYPEADSPASIKLAAAFALDQQKQFDRKFLAVIHELELPAAEIVLVDSQGMAEIAAALTHNVSPDLSIKQPQRAQAPDLEVFEDICTAINAPANAVPLFSSESPSQPSSSGVDTTFGFLNKWKGLVTSLHFASCEVLAGP